MNAKTFYALIGAAIVALLAAVLINSSKKPQSDTAAQAQRLLPELHGHVNDISTITLTGADNKVLATLKRGNDGWTVTEKANYPADVAKIREFILKLDQTTLVEQKTANEKRYAELGVDDVSGKDAKGVQVELAGLDKPVKLIVGNFNGAGGGGTFVRRAGDPQSWLANGNLAVAKNAADWEKRDLTDIAATRLQSVTLTSPDGKVLKAAKQERTDANFKVVDVPAGREASSDFVANSVGSVLSNLRADDAYPAKDMMPPEKVHKATYAAFDGLLIDVVAWDKDGKDYAQFAAHLDTAAANADIDKVQTKARADYDATITAASKKAADEKGDAAKAAADVPKPLAVSDAAKDRQDKLDALNKEIETLNNTFNGWTFAIPSYKFTDIAKSMEDMLKPIEQKKTAGKDAKKGVDKPPSLKSFPPKPVQ